MISDRHISEAIEFHMSRKPELEEKAKKCIDDEDYYGALVKLMQLHQMQGIIREYHVFDDVK